MHRIIFGKHITFVVVVRVQRVCSSIGISARRRIGVDND